MDAAEKTAREIVKQAPELLPGAAEAMVERIADKLRDAARDASAPFLALLDVYDDALCARKHGDVAAHLCVGGLRELLGVDGFERRRGII